MKKKFKEILRRITPQKLIELYDEPVRQSLVYGSVSYSQEGEDLILARLFNYKTNGFYIDIGAHHPMRFSNTYFFYKLGWRGINIDAMPGSMEPFRKLRERDINIEIGVSDQNEELTYYIFKEPALNGFASEVAYERHNFSPDKIISEVQLKTKTLSAILDDNLPEKQPIDFVSIDVEGHDLHILKSNNWSKYRPLIILIEDLENKSFSSISESEIVGFLNEKGYELIIKGLNNLYFQLKK